MVVGLFVVRVRWCHFGDWRRLLGGRVAKIDTAPFNINYPHSASPQNQYHMQWTINCSALIRCVATHVRLSLLEPDASRSTSTFLATAQIWQFLIIESLSARIAGINKSLGQ